MPDILLGVSIMKLPQHMIHALLFTLISENTIYK
jgi:hypothetical protein